MIATAHYRNGVLLGPLTGRRVADHILTGASLGELAYPAVAVIAGIYAYNADLKWSQWLGVALIVGTVTLLPIQRRRKMVALQARDAALASA